MLSFGLFLAVVVRVSACDEPLASIRKYPFDRFFGVLPGWQPLPLVESESPCSCLASGGLFEQTRGSMGLGAYDAGAVGAVASSAPEGLRIVDFLLRGNFVSSAEHHAFLIIAPIYAPVRGFSPIRPIHASRRAFIVENALRGKARSFVPDLDAAGALGQQGLFGGCRRWHTYGLGSHRLKMSAYLFSFFLS